jgi:hypothetical protein
MRTKLALAGLLAGAAAFVAPAPASAYCQEEIVVLSEGGGSGGGCTNSCYQTGEAYENVRTSLAEKVSAAEKLPGYWDLFACLD